MWGSTGDVPDNVHSSAGITAQWKTEDNPRRTGFTSRPVDVRGRCLRRSPRSKVAITASSIANRTLHEGTAPRLWRRLLPRNKEDIGWRLSGGSRRNLTYIFSG